MNYLDIILILIIVITILIFVKLKRRIIVHETAQQRNKENCKKRILEILIEQKKITNNEVEQALKVSDSTATNYLQELEDENKIKQIGKTGRGVYYKLK